MSLAPAGNDRVLSVLELTRAIKEALAEQFTGVWVKGELSGFKRADSGHLYFKLKDGKDAALDCVMWSRTASGLGFEPKEGLEIEAFGDITVYEPRGNYQFSVKQMRPAGLGALLLQLEQLKQRLTAEGLFDPARKRPLPRYPRRIGVVTSPVGAAIRDIVKVLRGRMPGIAVVFAPVRVQGPGAALEIADAIRRFNRHGAVDVLIVGRGGGSIEDLWAFNEEVVVRAIAGSAIPIVSAVGHEVDWTLADAAADVRAATPSNAAELVVCERVKLLEDLGHLTWRSRRALERRLESRRQALMHLTQKYGFQRLQQLFEGWHTTVGESTLRMRFALRSRLGSVRQSIEHLAASYALREWPRTLAALSDEPRELEAALAPALVRALHDRRRQVTSCVDQLRALSPRLVLERGYCLARGADGSVLRTVETLTVGERVTIEFARGEADARIETVRSGGPDAR